MDFVSISLYDGVALTALTGLRKLGSSNIVSRNIIPSSRKRCRTLSAELTGRSVLISGLVRWPASSPTDASELPDDEAGKVRFDLTDDMVAVEGDWRGIRGATVERLLGETVGFLALS